MLAMDLSHGGHLTHGAPVTRAAHTYNFVRYKMKDTATGEIDYDELTERILESALVRAARLDRPSGEGSMP